MLQAIGRCVSHGWVLAVMLSGLILQPTVGFGQDAIDVESIDSSSIHPVRLAVVGGVVVGGVTAIHLYQQDAWWKTSRAPFHFEEDLVYAKWIDKLGHLYGANVLTFVLSRGLRWASLSEGSALVWGAVGSTLFQTYVEVEDGFSAYWGFDRVDFAADLIGAWYPVLQHAVPFMNNFNFRFSYYPKNPGVPGAIPGQTHTVFDDYEGQTLWLSLTAKDLLPARAASWWPDFLAVSVGVAVRDNLLPSRYLEWYIAPELDMNRIIPQDTELLRTLSRALNFIHFPLPAVRIAPRMTFFGVYF
jgi:hypothetical protein